MDITVSTPIAKSLDERLTPEDHIVFQCLSCMTYLLPKEPHKIQREVYDSHGKFAGFEVVFQCPACHPKPHFHNGVPPQSNFEILTREKYDERRMYDKAGLIKVTDDKLPVL